MKNHTALENLVQDSASRQERAQQAALLAGTGALLSGILLLAAFLLPDEELSQHFILSISPLAMLPTVLFLYGLYRWEAPVLSNLTLLAGLAGVAPGPIQLAASGYLRVFGNGESSTGQLETLQTSLSGLAILFGSWIVATAYLSWASCRMPSKIAAAGLVTGLARMGISGSMALSTFSTLPFFTNTSLWNLALLLWIASYLVFTTWLGLWLISGKFFPAY